MLHAHGGRTSMVAVASLLIAVTGSGVAFAAETVEVTNLTVTEDNLQGWAHQAYDNDVYLDSNQQFVAGPGTPRRNAARTASCSCAIRSSATCWSASARRLRMS